MTPRYGLPLLKAMLRLSEKEASFSAMKLQLTFLHNVGAVLYDVMNA
jgi:hypothetical protein